MASGKITPKKTITATVTAGGGTNDHNRLFNREDVDQHPIEAITGLRTELDEKLDSETAMPLIEEAIKNKAKGLYYDVYKELSNKPYWYLTSEIDPETKQGTKASIISGPYDLGAGGGGGGGGVTEVTLSIAIDPESGKPMWPYHIAVGSTCIVGVNWSSLRDSKPTGRGTMYCYVSGKLVETRAVAQGLVTFDLTKYIVSGENKVEIKVVDAYNTSKNLIDTISGVTLRLASTFEDNLSYTGDISFPYTPTGDITKYVYFFVDGIQQGQPEVVDTTGEQWIRILPAALFNHGSHTLKVYFTCIIDDEEVKSNELYYDIIYYERGKTTPIIASPFISPAEIEQYVSFNIKYRVYTPNKNTSKINLVIDGDVVKSLTVDTSYQLWECRFDGIGNHILEIRTGSVSKVFNVHTTESTIHVEPVSQGVELALSAYGRENTEPIEERQKWNYIKDSTTIEGKLTGFNWTSNGWVKDTDGNTVLRLSGDARLSIEFKPFETDFTNTGKTFEFEIATSDVKNYESRVGECLDGADTITHSQFYAGEDTRTKKFIVDGVNNEKFIEKVQRAKGTYIFKFNGEKWNLDDTLVTHEELLSEYGITVSEIGGSEPIIKSEHYMNGDRIIIYYTVSGHGFYITPQLAKLQSQLASLSTQYKEDDKVRLTFVVESRSAGTTTFKTRLIYMYINGIMSGVSKYPDGDSFQQIPAKFITFGSNDATLDIYNIRIYNQALTRRQVVNNWIADTKDPVLKTKRYRHNDNYDNDTGKIVIDKIAALGDLPYLVAETEVLPRAKKDRKYAKITYVNPGDTDRNFTAEEARMDVQGTSSSGYYRKNFKIKYEGGFYDNDQNWSEHYKLRGDKSKKEKEFTYKADVASSEGANNVELVRYFEDSKNWFSPPELQPDPDLGTTDSKLRIRVGIDGLPIVMFHNDGEKTYFYGKMNFNNDKGNKRTYGFAEGDESWELLHNTSDLVLFKSDDLTDWKESFESRYPEEAGEDEHPYGTLPEERAKLQAVMTWVVSTYRKATDTEEQKAEKLARFKDEFTQHFDLNSSLFYYLYTELFLMVDSRAKNAMLTYMASRDGGRDGGNKWFWFPYDMDTALGTNNEGLLVYNYDKEDTDYQEGAYIFNGQDSVFWNNVRDAFGDELKSMYNTLRASATSDRIQWSFANAEKYFEDHQNVWSESIFNEDAYEKYLYPYIYNQDATYLGMAQGSKEQQRRWWMYNRFRYLDSKYCSGDAAACQIMMRPYWSHAPYKSFETLEEYAGKDKYGQQYYIVFNAGTSSAVIKAFDELTTEEKEWVRVNKPVAYTRNVFELKPYINSYVAVRYEKQESVVSKRGAIGTVSPILSPETWRALGKDAVLWIDSADLLEDIGDISAFKPGYADFSKATKLKRLVVGSADPLYENGNLKGLNVGANHLLTYLDARNCKNLGEGSGTEVTPTIDLSNCYSIEEVYFDNTQIQGCSFPVGGNLKKVHLPETLTNLTIRNHPNLTEFNLAGTSKLTSIWLEDVPSSVIDSYDYVMAMPNGSRVRLININDTFESEEKIATFYAKLDKMHGTDANGDFVTKAQITGKIHVENISYSGYTELSAKYPEVTIDATNIICTVKFYEEKLKDGSIDEYEWIIYDSQNIKRGTDAQDPIGRHENPPSKTPTQKYYYEFKKWDKSYLNIQSDINIYALFDEHLQVYRVSFDTQSSIITVEPEYEDIEYGYYATEPTLHNIPPQVIHKGWYDNNGKKFEFTTTPIVDNITLYAKWQDESAPQIVLERQSYNKFKYTVTDNVGVVAWQVTTENVQPTTWVPITPSARHSGVYEVAAASDYYFWAKDNQDNVSSEKIVAHKLTTILTKGVTAIQLTEDENILSTFALDNTTIKVLAILDTHFENVELRDNNIIIENGSMIAVTAEHTFKATCTPKSYLVQFDNLGRGTKPEDQTIVYENKVTEPQPQIDSGYVIEGWYLEDTFITKWNFTEYAVDGNMTLYAKWIVYHDPTKMFITIPENNYEVVFNYKQDVASGCELDFGDGSSTYISLSAGYVSVKHTYEAAGDYTAKIKSIDRSYYLGKNFDNQVIMPIDILTDIEFAWDVTSVNQYAFKSAKFTNINLTRFMTVISTGMFYDCKNLLSLTLPNNIEVIETQAFYGCIGIAGEVIIPNKVVSLGEGCFGNCKSITKLTLPNGLASIGLDCFSDCESLTTINIPTNLLTLQSGLFYNCKNLLSLNIPSSVTSVGYSAFNGCEKLNKLIFNSKNITFSSIGYTYNKCYELKTAGPIGGNYNIEFAFDEEIPDYCFAGVGTSANNALTSIVLPDTITRIGKYAFWYQPISAIRLPNSLLEIGERAFVSCQRLESITIPSSVKKIGPVIVGGCDNLKTFYMRAIGIDESSRVSVDPSDAWAWGCTSNLVIHYMDTLTEESCISHYGQYWLYRTRSEVHKNIGDISD